MLPILIILLGFYFCETANAQEVNDFERITPYFNVKLIVGVPLVNRWSKRNAFLPNVSLSGSAGAQVSASHIQGHFMLTATFLRGGLGTSLIPLGQTDTRFEAVATAALTTVWDSIGGRQNPMNLMIPTFHSRSAAYIPMVHGFGGSIGSHFVFCKTRVAKKP